MAYTLHWSNPTVHVSRDELSGTKTRSTHGNTENLYRTALDYHEKVGSLTPALHLTADVLYPNALSSASANSNDTGIDDEQSQNQDESAAQHCRGSQLDESFPLQQRLPACLPLVQFTPPVNVNLHLLEEPNADIDMCAFPVLNWESQIRALKEPLLLPYKYLLPAKLESIKKLRSDLQIRNISNVLYNYHGACDWTFDSTSTDGRILLVGKSESLRAVKLQRSSSHSSSMCSYCVTEIFDEVPTHLGTMKKNQKSFDQLIFQIISHRKDSIAAVRRGITIDLYNTRDKPLFLSSIPAYGYGYSAEYKKYARGLSKEDILFSIDSKPKFLSLDFNASNPCELATLDENRVIQFHDVVAETSSAGMKSPLIPEMEGRPPGALAHDFEMDHAAGLLYANDSNTLYFYDGSQIFFYDKRENYKIMGVKQSLQSHSLLNLRSGKSSQSISDQRYFTSSKTNETSQLNEYVTCVQRSANSNYYYVGTTYRILLMDWRVPSNPVLKMSHGMRSSANYIDTNHNKNYEVVIAGSQRNSEIFSAVIDFAHVKCRSKSECSAKNPVLQSYPRHLSNQRDFIDTVKNDEIAEESQIRNRYNAWCTGLTICDLPRNRGYRDLNKPPGIIVVSTNNHGDVFYQEWLQKPLENSSLRNHEDSEWGKFIEQWKSSRELISTTDSKPVRPTQYQSLLPEDCSMAIEPTIELMKTVKVKQSNFNNLNINLVQYYHTQACVKPIQDSAVNLKKFQGSRVQPFLDVWESDWSVKEDFVGLSDSEKEVNDVAEHGILNSNLLNYNSILNLDETGSALLNGNSTSNYKKDDNDNGTTSKMEIKEEVEQEEDELSDVDMFGQWLSES